MGRIVIFPTKYEAMCCDAVSLLREKGHDIVFFKGKSSHLDAADTARWIGNADVAIVGMGECDASVFEACLNLKGIVKFGVGTDNIDLDEARKHGIKVANAPGCNSNAVADLTVSLMLDMMRSVSTLVEDLHGGIWSRNIGSEIEGKRIGLVGYGAIAQLVSKKLMGFDCSVVAYDIRPNREMAGKYGVSFVTMDELLSTSDIISLHAPGVKENYHMLDSLAFGKMKRGVYLVNAARGSLVDTDALLEAVENGIVAKAALDVFEKEPLPPSSPLLSSRNIYCTPHTAGETYESYLKLGLSTARAALDILDGVVPVNCVNR